MIDWAGGRDDLARPGEDSIRIPWEEVLQWDPEVLLVAPCGFNARSALEQGASLKGRLGWEGLRAVKEGKVFALDANSYFARPSLRLTRGIELLAHIFHPGDFPWEGPPDAYFKL
jgi:iron complex transport system substrate-binding protein